MCGFSGIVSQEIHDPHCLVQSLQAIKHRGPDDSRIYSFETGFSSLPFSNATSKAKFAPFSQPSSAMFGFNRLSIVDLSDKGMQPFVDDKNQTLFMMNGEVYNYKELRQTYLSDVPFASDSDSEVAFRLYQKLGDDFIHLLRGMYAIVVYNKSSKQLKAWRDPMGIKPLYYAVLNDGIVFSSEMKGIFATGLLNKNIDPQGLAYSMYLGTCPSPITLYKDVQSLRPGHMLLFQSQTNRVLETMFWALDYQPENRPIHFDEFAADVETICSLYQTGDVPKGLMLSGGIDSGTLAHFLGKTDKTLKCYNLYTQNHPTDESAFASKNATNAGLDITFFDIPSSPPMGVIERYLSSEEEPNTGPEPTLYLCDKVNHLGVKVMFNALGPDELFGGYRYYALINKYGQSKLLNNLPLICFPNKLKPKIAEVKQFGWETFPLISRHFFSWKSITLYFQNKGYEVPEHPIAYLLNQVRGQMPQFDRMPILKKASYLDIHYFIASHHAFRSDQPSMLNSIELRFPFLDHLFVQKYFNQAWLFNGIDHQLKPAFRNYAKYLLPKDVIEMPKKGFTMPTELWMNSITKHPDAIFSGTPEKLWYGAMLHHATQKPL
jgi:asparagine synthase (glutamine-hydrolysing)